MAQVVACWRRWDRSMGMGAADDAAADGRTEVGGALRRGGGKSCEMGMDLLSFRSHAAVGDRTVRRLALSNLASRESSAFDREDRWWFWRLAAGKVKWA